MSIWRTVFEFSGAGWCNWAIVAVSVVGTLAFLERLYDLHWRRRLATDTFIAKVLNYVERHEFRNALSLCETPSTHPLVLAVRAGLLRANRREKDVERAMEKEMLAELPHLQKRISLIALLANTVTLLGLLGTVFGLMVAFSAAPESANRHAELAAGMAHAMGATALGLIAAIPLLAFHHILARRAERIVIDVESGASALLVTLSAVAQQQAAAPDATGAAIPMRRDPTGGRVGGAA